MWFAVEVLEIALGTIERPIIDIHHDDEREVEGGKIEGSMTVTLEAIVELHMI